MNQYSDYIKTKRIQKLTKHLIISALLITPILIIIRIILSNNSLNIDDKYSTILGVAITILVLVFILSLYFKIRFRKTKRINIQYALGVFCLVVAYSIELVGITYTIYNNDEFKKWVINSSMNTFNYQFFATMLYSDQEIKNVLSINTKDINIEERLITFDNIIYNQKKYKDKFEEAILTKDNEDDIYKIIKVSGTTKYTKYKYSGYLAVIYDPSKVKLATSSGAGIDNKSYGETIETIARRNNALVAINAGGFYDPTWSSNGGIPHGLVISNEEVKTDFRRALNTGGIIGFDKDNRLILKKMTKKEALEIGIRDCVDFGPFLIINGENMYKNTRGYWGYEPRTAIAQRKDGIVLMLVIDGRQSYSKGVDLNDLADILLKYGAYNAANLDGGTSSTMVVNNKVINTPHNGYSRTIRSMPNAFIVTE